MGVCGGSRRATELRGGRRMQKAKVVGLSLALVARVPGRSWDRAVQAGSRKGGAVSGWVGGGGQAAELSQIARAVVIVLAALSLRVCVVEGGRASGLSRRSSVWPSNPSGSPLHALHPPHVPAHLARVLLLILLLTITSLHLLIVIVAKVNKVATPTPAPLASWRRLARLLLLWRGGGQRAVAPAWRSGRRCLLLLHGELLLQQLCLLCHEGRRELVASLTTPHQQLLQRSHLLSGAWREGGASHANAHGQPDKRG